MASLEIELGGRYRSGRAVGWEPRKCWTQPVHREVDEGANLGYRQATLRQHEVQQRIGKLMELGLQNKVGVEKRVDDYTGKLGGSSK